MTGTRKRFRILLIVGTRPDALKMYPVYRGLKEKDFDVVLLSTTQHSELLSQVFDELGFAPDISLNVMEEDQKLPRLTGRLADKLDEAIRESAPDLVLVQGDTTSSMVGALVSYYHRIPVNHIEAGLRTGDPYQPFPEEINRKVISQIADFHFTPTPRALGNLLAEGVGRDRVLVTGNTAIDTLLEILSRKPEFRNKRLKEVLETDAVVIAVTAHRRESFGEPLEELLEAMIGLARELKGTRIVYPVHPNPSVHGPVTRALSGRQGIELVDPLGYGDLVRLLDRSRIILTDSGGIQEEAPSLGKPVLVLREKTERQESIDAGIARLVGMNRQAIVETVFDLLRDEERYQAMVPRGNPYGDGKAAGRIVQSIRCRYLGSGTQPEEFHPPCLWADEVCHAG